MAAREPGLQICFLGKPALFVNGRLQPLAGPRKAIVLLAYLLAHRDRPLSRAAVAERFWPDDDDEAARAGLRRQLYRAIAALPEAPENRPWIIADKTTLRWNPAAAVRFDAAEYERLCSAGERDSAVALYRGDFLEDFSDDWCLVERERLRQVHASNLGVLSEQCRRAFDYPGAIDYAQALLQLDPLREDAIRRLMELRFAAGDRAGALADFDRFAKRLRAELGTDPMPETIAVHDAIRRNTALQPATDDQQLPLAPKRGLPFTGRVDAVASLRRAWETAARGRGLLALVSGEAGIGKSRLIAELVAIAQAQGGRVVTGSTSAIEAEPYQPIAEALRLALPMLHGAKLDPAMLSALKLLWADAGENQSDSPPLPALGTERERARLFDAIAGALAGLAEKRPVLIVLEDVHWASSATMDLIAFVVRALREQSALVVVSFREEDVAGTHGLHAFLRPNDAARSVHLALGPLDAADIQSLVVAARGSRDEDLERKLLAASSGNPLFLTELLRNSEDGMDVEGVPAGVSQMVAVRIARLSDRARSLLETAGVCGASFDSDLLRVVSGSTFAEVFDGLDELVDRALVRKSPQRRSDFAFTHQLVRDAVYGALPHDARTTAHRRVGRALEQLYADRPALSATIARHFDAAGRRSEAARHYTSAARYARSVYAHEEVFVHTGRALELTAGARARFDLHLLREEAAAHTGDAARAAECAALRTLAIELGDTELLGESLRRAALLAAELGDVTGENDAIDALRSLSAGIASRWPMEAVLLDARRADRTDWRAAAQLLAEAEHSFAGADEDLRFDYWLLRAAVTARSDVAEARECAARARHEGQTPALRARVLRVECRIADNAGDYHQLGLLTTELLALCCEIGDLEGQANAHQLLGVVAWYQFDLASERDHISGALGLFERVQKPIGRATMLLNRGVMQQHTGAFAAAERDYVEARSVAEAAGARGVAALASADLASLASLRGDHERGREIALATLAGLHAEGNASLDDVMFEYLGAAECGLGMFDQAIAHLESALRARQGHDRRGALELLIELVPAYVGAGQLGEALVGAQALVRSLDEDRHTLTFPAQALSTAARAFEAVGQIERAAELDIEASTLLAELAARIPDAETREGYLSLRFHRDIRDRAGRVNGSPAP
jgi:DNA-binding SARP family transcriptional activator